jgi:hypothetical protein
MGLIGGAASNPGEPAVPPVIEAAIDFPELTFVAYHAGICQQQVH